MCSGGSENQKMEIKVSVSVKEWKPARDCVRY